MSNIILTPSNVETEINTALVMSTYENVIDKEVILTSIDLSNTSSNLLVVPSTQTFFAPKTTIDNPNEYGLIRYADVNTEVDDHNNDDTAHLDIRLIAETAESNSETAVATANEAKETADNAESVALGIDAKASEALSNSETAVSTANEAKAIALGIEQAKVFDTFEDMETWLKDEANKGLHTTGLELLIKSDDVPDYWVTAVLETPNASGYYYDIEENEASVLSVNGKKGVVVLKTDDVSDAEQTNKWSTADEKEKVSKIVISGDGKKALLNNGEYGEVGTVDTVNNVLPDENKNITITADDIDDTTTTNKFATESEINRWNDYDSNFEYTNGLVFNSITNGYRIGDETTTNGNGYTGTATKILIPKYYDDGVNGIKPVIEIGQRAFRGISTITEIYIPETVATIGDSAFAQITALKRINIPYAVSSIPSLLFYQSTGLEEISLSSNVLYFGDGVFSGCTDLKKIYINSTSVPTLYDPSATGNLISDSGVEQIMVLPDLIDLYNADTNWARLSSYIYAKPEGKDLSDKFDLKVDKETGKTLTTNDLTDELKDKYDNTYELSDEFYYTSGLVFTFDTDHYYVGDGTTNIKNGYPYPGTESELFIPKYYNDGTNGIAPVTKIGQYAFSNYGSLDKIHLPNSIIEIEGHAFSYSYLSEIELPDSVTTIGTFAFNAGPSTYTKLQNVKLSKNLVTIGDRAFQNCQGISEIEIFDKIESIGTNAFYATGSSLTKITIHSITPPSLSFSLPSSLTQIQVPKESLTAYKEATNWSAYADRIFAIPDGELVQEIIDDVTAIQENYVTTDTDQDITGEKSFKDDVNIGEIATPKNLNIVGDLNIEGDIIQAGSTYETHAEQVYTTKDEIILREGAVAGLATGALAKITAKLYDGINDGVLGFDKDGIARVGDVGSEQAIATREDTPTDKGVARWDESTFKFVTETPDTTPTESSTKLATSGGIKTALELKADKLGEGFSGNDLAADVNKFFRWGTLTFPTSGYIDYHATISVKEGIEGIVHSRTGGIFNLFFRSVNGVISTTNSNITFIANEDGLNASNYIATVDNNIVRFYFKKITQFGNQHFKILQSGVRGSLSNILVVEDNSTAEESAPTATITATSAAVAKAYVDTKATTQSYTATLSSASWTGSSAPYSKEVTVTGILATDKLDFDLDLSSATYANIPTIQSAWFNVYRKVPSANTITFYSHEIPSIDIPLTIKVVR